MRVVLKLGSSVLTAGTDRIYRPRLVEVMRGVAAARAAGHGVTLVTSGAVAAGWEALGFPERERTLAEKQLLAAVGQGQLMHLYASLAELYGLATAQLLLTADDFRDRTRYLNARTTLEGCLSRGVLPIVNENDEIEIAHMMYISLSFDHRLVDGAEAARFCKEVIRLLENPDRLMLEAM